MYILFKSNTQPSLERMTELYHKYKQKGINEFKLSSDQIYENSIHKKQHSPKKQKARAYSINERKSTK